MNVLCAVCSEDIPGSSFGEGKGLVADHAVYKCGELQYFELAHVACAKADPHVNWDFDEPTEEQSA